MNDEVELEVDGLNISFDQGDNYKVRDINFKLEAGKVTALVGESGSGKSISSKAVMQLLPDEVLVEGTAYLDTQVDMLDAEREKLNHLRGNKISFIFQDALSAMHPLKRIGEQIYEAVDIHLSDLNEKIEKENQKSQNKQKTLHSKEDIRQYILNILQSVGLEDPQRIYRSYPHEVSGGQLQRANIAMAISCKPQVLIADEITTALDVQVQAQVLKLLKKLCVQQNMALLIITHNMAVVAQIADYVIVLKNGVIVEQSVADDILHNSTDPYTNLLLDSVPSLGEAKHIFGDKGEVLSDEVIVELKDVYVQYSRKSIFSKQKVEAGVKDINLHINRGEMVALVGKSGSGKSTIGNVVSGLLPVDAGTLTIDGEIAKTGHFSKELAKQIGVVFQNPLSSLNPKLTVAQSIAEPLKLHTQYSKEQIDKRVLELLELVELDAEYAERKPGQLSGGQLQRIAIARAIALNPKIVVADEPTSALDVSVQAKVLTTLLKLQRELGFACMFITHDLAVVEEIAHRVYVLANGEIVEQGRVVEVFAHPQHAYTKSLIEAFPRF